MLVACFPNTTHGSGWIVQVQPTGNARGLFPKYHPRKRVDCSSSAYKKCSLPCFPNTTHGRSRETKGAELTSQKKASGKSGSVGFYRASLLTACSFGPLAHHFDASDFFFTPSFRLAVETLSVHVCVEFKSWPAPIELSTADESIVEGCRSHRPR